MLSCSFFLWLTVVRGQDVQVSAGNKTISVVVSETVEMEPDLAAIHIGYRNFGSEKDTTYAENVRAANKIIKALLDGGVPKERIETTELGLMWASEDTGRGSEQQKERKFEAHQSWTIRVSPRDAQKVVDIAIGAGANEIEEVQWEVADVAAMEARAHSAALAKARNLAGQMAQSLGVKIGQLLFLSNESPESQRMRKFNTQTIQVSASPIPQLVLFPQKVTRMATVHAVFALE